MFQTRTEDIIKINHNMRNNKHHINLTSENNELIPLCKLSRPSYIAIEKDKNAKKNKIGITKGNV